jgi:hypothetical protein
MLTYAQQINELANIDLAVADGVLSLAEGRELRESLEASWQCSRDAQAVTVPRAGAEKPLPASDKPLSRFTESVGYTLLAARVGMIDDQTAIDLLTLFLDAEACHSAALDMRNRRSSYHKRTLTPA